MAKFEDLDVWKRSARLSAELYKEFISLKDYGFKDQKINTCTPFAHYKKASAPNKNE